MASETDSPNGSGGSVPSERRFPSPSAVEAPPGAEDWRRAYPYYYPIEGERKEYDEEQFWFFDGMHNPEPVYPFDSIMPESWWVFLNLYLTRVWMVPPTLGIDQRLSTATCTSAPPPSPTPREIGRAGRAVLPRAGYYYENWDEIYDNWIVKAEDCIGACAPWS